MFWVYLLLVIKAFSVNSEPKQCEYSSSTVPNEGNIGEAPHFPWLGVLKVHLHDAGTFKIALTGIVYVKEGYAIANADDVARIPKRIFKGDSKAMFIPENQTAWSCKLVDYMTHPEYQYSTMNTIALLELDLGEESHFPMKPICWPPYSFNTSNVLYAVGFTDENTLLEKTVYSLQYVEQTLCEEFYTRAGLTEKQFTPMHYTCGFAKNNKNNCVWDNGMVLASNSTGYWTLVGFGIRGPGCAAPARFIDMLPYLMWIDSATDEVDIEEDQLDFRKSAFNEGFKKSRRLKDSEEIILDELADPRKLTAEKYQYNAEDIVFKRLSNTSITLELQGRNGSCEDKRSTLIYNDETKIYYEGTGQVKYRVSLNDLFISNFSCILVQLKSLESTRDAYIDYSMELSNREGPFIPYLSGTPGNIIKKILIPQVAPKPKNNSTDWEPGPHLQVQYLEDNVPRITYDNVEVYLTFHFRDEGMLKLSVYGINKPPIQNTINETTTANTLFRNRDEFETTTANTMFRNRDEFETTTANTMFRNRDEYEATTNGNVNNSINYWNKMFDGEDLLGNNTSELKSDLVEDALERSNILNEKVIRKDESLKTFVSCASRSVGFSLTVGFYFIFVLKIM